MDPQSNLITEAQAYDFSGVAADFNAAPIVHQDSLSPVGAKMMDVYKPFIEAVDWESPDKGLLGPKAVRDRYRDTYKLLMADAIHKLLRTPEQQLRRESMIAGTDVTTYHKQIIRTVLRAYPRLIAPQLVPVLPMTGPTARVYFEILQYDTTYASSTPNVAVGDAMDDLSKFNSGYAAQAVQLTDLNAIKLSMENYVEISEATHGLSATSSLQFEDDLATVHGVSYNNYISDRLFSMLQWYIDRRVIGAMVAAVPAGSNVAWTRNPTINGTAWANLNPSEKKAYGESIWRDGFIPAMTKIYSLRYEYPNFAICGSLAAEDIRGLSMFQPVDVFNPGEVNIQAGAIRDLGSLNAGGLRVLVDPQINPNLILLGIRPTESFKPAVCWCPYRAIGFANDLYYPRSLKHEKGAYTRYGIAQPANGNTPSARLGDGYSTITIS